MGFLNLTLNQSSTHASFDPAKVIEKARGYFPEATFKEGDQADEEVRSAKLLLGVEGLQDPTGPAAKVMESLRGKASRFGPNYSFQIPVPGAEPILGLARSVNVQFTFKQPLPELIRQRLIDFLKELGFGKLEEGETDQGYKRVLMEFSDKSLNGTHQAPWIMKT
jgi:hypothetical protein